MEKLFLLFEFIYQNMKIFLLSISIIIVFIIFYKIIMRMKRKNEEIAVKKSLVRNSLWKRFIEENILNYFIWSSDWYKIKSFKVIKDMIILEFFDLKMKQLMTIEFSLLDEDYDELFYIIENLMSITVKDDNWFLINVYKEKEKNINKQEDNIKNNSNSKEDDKDTIDLSDSNNHKNSFKRARINHKRNKRR